MKACINLMNIYENGLLGVKNTTVAAKLKLTELNKKFSQLSDDVEKSNLQKF